MDYQAVIGLEVHAELLTQSKMFCGCRVVDSTTAEPNRYTCPVCAGMPGALPVANQRAVQLALMVALALKCKVAPESIFARKNYFYPDLPKGYQISQYERPLATDGHLSITGAEGERNIHIRRVHLEEDTGKLLHRESGARERGASLVDLNRAGVPLLEIVSEPDLRSEAEAITYAKALQAILTYLGVNSGDMEKGVIRYEANISVRERGSETLATRTEIKNLNSFRALQRSLEYEIERQMAAREAGSPVRQQTLGWDEARGVTVAQRSKEHAHDYRYLPEPDLPPLQIDPDWVQQIRADLPELPAEKTERFRAMGLNEYDARVLVAQRPVAEFFETAVRAGAEAHPPVHAKTIANWVSSQLFGLLNTASVSIEKSQITPERLVYLLALLQAERISANSAKQVLREVVATGAEPQAIISERGMEQVSDPEAIAQAVEKVLEDNPEQLASYLSGKETLANWFFGQMMRASSGRANPEMVRAALQTALQRRADSSSSE
jgi:aspartyl-tRNA(Asn)/glutamyl-tRNA(Gln) amidotransferase subunit B